MNEFIMVTSKPEDIRAVYMQLRTKLEIPKAIRGVLRKLEDQYRFQAITFETFCREYVMEMTKHFGRIDFRLAKSDNKCLCIPMECDEIECNRTDECFPIVFFLECKSIAPQKPFSCMDLPQATEEQEDAIFSMMLGVMAEDNEDQVHRVRNFMYFLFNFPANWVVECFDNWSHMNDKYTSIMGRYTTSIEGICKFFMELDPANQAKMIDWVNINFKN